MMTIHSMRRVSIKSFIRKSPIKAHIHMDILGATSSLICLAHCLATPFLFMAQTCSVTCLDESPVWWVLVDYSLLGISFVAVYHAAQTSFIRGVKFILWLSWVALFMIILNESIHLMELPEWLIYIPTITLIIGHLYNHRHGCCKTEICCGTANEKIQGPYEQVR